MKSVTLTQKEVVKASLLGEEIQKLIRSYFDTRNIKTLEESLMVISAALSNVLAVFAYNMMQKGHGTTEMCELLDEINLNAKEQLNEGYEMMKEEMN